METANTTSGETWTLTMETFTSWSPQDLVVNLGVQMLGLPGPAPIFYIIHLVAIGCLLVSIVSSGVVLFYSFVKERHIKFWTLNTGERLAIYLAICDILHHITHTVDHLYVFIIQDFPPGILCQIFGFFLLNFPLAQALIVTFTAFSACMMIVRERRLSMGRYDWRLLVPCVGTPLVLTVIAAAFGYTGPSGAWCAVDMSKKYGPLVSNIVTIAIMVAFFVNLVCYLLVGLKIKQISSSMAAMDERGAASSRRYQRSIQIMMLFVAVYIIQWWAYVVYFMWTFFAMPHLVATVAVVSFTNLGGLFNSIAYVFVRQIKNKSSNASSNKLSVSTRQTGIKTVM